jgi:hypothetical protein
VTNVSEYGASPDANGIQTLSFQAAINATFESGGGTILVPAGRYHIGTLSLRSNVTLHLESGAVLVGSADLTDYPLDFGGFTDAVGQRRGRCLICAVDARRVAISGRGVIDGNGGAFARDLDDRPFLLRFIRCSDVSVTDVSLRDAAAWVSHFMECERVALRGVTIRSRVNANNDGIDIDACRNVRISDCDIDTGDDAVCIKSTTGGPCRNVTVSQCLLKSDWAALKLGTESAGDFQNIIFSHCVIYDTTGGGLKVITTDGGRLENLLVTDLVMHRVSGPIFMQLGSRLRAYHGKPAAEKVGAMRNVTLRNIQADVWEEGEPLWGQSRRAGICITGLPDVPIEGLTLEDIRIHFPGGGTAREAARLEVPELPDHYPEFTIYAPLPAYGFYVRHARGATLRNIQLQTLLPDARPALVCDDIDDIAINDWSAAMPADGTMARARNCRKVNWPFQPVTAAPIGEWSGWGEPTPAASFSSLGSPDFASLVHRTEPGPGDRFRGQPSDPSTGAEIFQKVE